MALCIQQLSYDTHIVMDGGGHSDGTEIWLRGQAGNACLKQVFNKVEFQKFFNGWPISGSQGIFLPRLFVSQYTPARYYWIVLNRIAGA